MSYIRSAFSRFFRPAVIVGIIAFSFFLAFHIANAQTASNLIANPGFETEGTGGNPANWLRTYWGTPAPTFTYPVSGRSGKAPAISFGQSSNGDARWQHTAVTVEPGATYTYSNWYKSTAATEVNVEFTSSSGGKSYGWVAALPSSSNAWVQASVSLTIPANVTKVSVYHLLDRSGSLVIDDVSLSKNGAPSPNPNPNPTPTTTPSLPGSFAEGMVTLSFDDSWTSQYTNALPILDAAGLKGTFYITSQPIQLQWTGFMTAANVKTIHQKGHEIGGHTVTHADLTTLSRTQLSQELRNSKTYIQGIIGSTISSVAYPYGAYNSAVKSATQTAGYSNGRSTDLGLNVKTTDKYALKSECPLKTTPFSQIKQAIDDAKANKQWYILCLHEVKEGGDEYSMTPAQLQQIVNYIKSSGIKAVTVKEGRALMQ